MSEAVCEAALCHIRRVGDAMRGHSVDVSDDWLMGASGEAFCVYFHPDGTFLTPFVHSWDSALAAVEACGGSARWLESERGTRAGPTLEAIAQAVASGRSVIGPGIRAATNGVNSQCHYWFLVDGVDVEHRTVRLRGDDQYVRLPSGDSPDPREHPRWYGIVRNGRQHYADNPALLVDPPGDRPATDQVVQQALHRAVALAHEPPVELGGYGGGTYLAGLAALVRLRDDLAAARGDGVEEFKRLNPAKGDPFGGLHEELLHLQLLSERRRLAAGFLEQAMGCLPTTAHASLRSAAAHYRDVSHSALQAFELRHGTAAELEVIEGMIRDEAYLDDPPEWAAYWAGVEANLADPGLRTELVALLGQAIESERAAVEAVRVAIQ